MDSSKIPQRRSVRLMDYDYSQCGGYFVTICTYRMGCLFGEIATNGEMHFNQFGQIVMQEWHRMGMLRQKSVELDAFVVMPNHIHGIILIVEDSQSQSTTTSSKLTQSNVPPRLLPDSLGSIVGGFKSAVTRQIHAISKSNMGAVWQRSFHDVIIRDEMMLNTIRQYIQTNPGRWAEDRYYSNNK